MAEQKQASTESKAQASAGEQAGTAKKSRQNPLMPIFQTIFKISYITGSKIKVLGKRFFYFVRNSIIESENHIVCAVKKGLGRAKKGVVSLFGRFKKRWGKVCGFCHDVYAVKEEKGILKSLGYLWHRIFNKKNARTLLNYGAPLAGICALAVVVNVTLHSNVALAVEVNGKVMGYVQSEATFETANSMLQERVVYDDGQEPVEVTAQFRLSIVGSDQMATADELCNNLILNSGIDIVEASGLYVDQKLIGAVTDKESLQSMLDSILSEYKTDDADAEVSFVKKVEIKDGLYVKSSVKPFESLQATVTGNVEGEVKYSVVAGDSPLLIASKNGVRYADLLKLNPGIDEALFPGQELLIQKSQPFLGVQVVKTESYEKQIPYTTKEVQDASRYKGAKSVQQEGENGIAQITAKVTYVDGVETARDILSEQVTKEAVEKVVAVGTKAPPTTYTGPVSIVASGNYIWPLSGGAGYVSWSFGGGHRGMDIAAPAGTPIMAVDKGTVVRVDQRASEGKNVIIDHGNGWKTYYYHASVLLAQVGQTVNQGDVIALVGRTGFATGNHLHIEFWYGGRPYNPAQFVGSKSR